MKRLKGKKKSGKGKEVVIILVVGNFLFMLMFRIVGKFFFRLVFLEGGVGRVIRFFYGEEYGCFSFFY